MELKYFNTEEFDSPDVKGSWVNMNVEFLKLLDIIRGHAKIPFIINSAFRTEAHNAKVGGVSESAHTKGLAVDIVAVSGIEKFLIITAALTYGINRIGIGKTFIHLDVDKSLPRNVIWTC